MSTCSSISVSDILGPWYCVTMSSYLGLHLVSVISPDPLVSLLEFVTVQVSVSSCLCHWICEYMSVPDSLLICFSACACVFGFLSPSLYLCHTSISVFLQVSGPVSLFSSHLLPHVCKSACLCVSVSTSLSLCLGLRS